MTIKDILRYPNPKLLMASDPVEVFDEKLVELSGDLQETARAYRAEGLAAIQIGVLYRAFVIKDGEDYITCINPEILGMKTDVLNSHEGCLSFPGVNETVKRAEAVEVQYQNEGGEVQKRWLTGVQAVAFQHELDHLNGILFTEHMGKLQKRMALKKLEKVNRRTKIQMKNIQKMLAQSGESARV